MKTRILFVAISLLILLGCEKQPEINDYVNQTDLDHFISLSFAKEIATTIEFSESTKSNGITEKSSKIVTNVSELKDSRNLTATYVFNYSPEGFLLLSADDRTIPVLGFSDSGTFDSSLSNASPEFIFWYSEFTEEIDLLRYEDNEIDASAAWNLNDIQGLISANTEFDIKNNSDRLQAADECYYPGMPGCCEDTWYTKGPIMSTTWNQGLGYNNQCPYMNCTQTGNGRAWTGCVATAMAQVMKYKQKPSWFNWSSMPNTTGSSTTSSLMSTLGNALEMNYSCSGSGTQFSYAKDAFKQYYQYYSAKEADFNQNTVKQQLNSNHPVMLSGGTHAWVTDGYRTHYDCQNGIGYLYLYMNWGWGGSYNGWYAFNNWYISSSHNYNSNKRMIYDLY